MIPIHALWHFRTLSFWDSNIHFASIKCHLTVIHLTFLTRLFFANHNSPPPPLEKKTSLIYSSWKVTFLILRWSSNPPTFHTFCEHCSNYLIGIGTFQLAIAQGSSPGDQRSVLPPFGERFRGSCPLERQRLRGCFITLGLLRG